VFNGILLSLYHAPEFPNQPRTSKPPPIQVDGAVEYEAEEIIALQPTKLKGVKLDYFVHWRGYPITERTWE
ncbi:hypothetical protein SERLA73DRAFT_42728, partial [Serpula lacrymans var. lacrymans S7.3]